MDPLLPRRRFKPRGPARHRHRRTGAARSRGGAALARAVRRGGVARPVPEPRLGGRAAPPREPRRQEDVGRHAHGVRRLRGGGARRQRGLGIEAQVRVPRGPPLGAARRKQWLGGRQRQGGVVRGSPECRGCVPGPVRQVRPRRGHGKRSSPAQAPHGRRLARPPRAERPPRAREFPHPARHARHRQRPDPRSFGDGGRDVGMHGHLAAPRPQPVRPLRAQGLGAVAGAQVESAGGDGVAGRGLADHEARKQVADGPHRGGAVIPVRAAFASNHCRTASRATEFRVRF
mmetsp:Transcript_5848/g.16960  ORF Transcript_5848/g.16960 Transcript_5848/m.16960 type:complete len:288 (+) Transcript_5848:726-1589(+)